MPSGVACSLSARDSPKSEADTSLMKIRAHIVFFRVASHFFDIKCRGKLHF